MNDIGKAIATVGFVVGVIFVNDPIVKDIFLAILSGMWVLPPVARALGIKGS